MNLLRNTLVGLIVAVAATFGAHANSAYLSTSPVTTRAQLGALTQAQSASAAYQNVYLTELGYQAAYHYDTSSTATCPSTTDAVICPSDYGSTGRWLVGVSASPNVSNATGVLPPANGGFFQVASIAALNALTDAQSTSYQKVGVSGYFGVGTPGGGNFDYTTGGPATADNVLWVASSNISCATRCWNREVIQKRLTIFDAGAKSDGTTVDTTADQALLTAVAGTKYTAVWPATAAANVSGTLTVAANTNILFDGGTLLRNPSATDSGAIFTITGSNVTIEGTGILNGNSTNGSYGNCIKADGAYTGIVIGGPGLQLINCPFAAIIFTNVVQPIIGPLLITNWGVYSNISGGAYAIRDTITSAPGADVPAPIVHDVIADDSMGTNSTGHLLSGFFFDQNGTGNPYAYNWVNGKTSNNLVKLPSVNLGAYSIGINFGAGTHWTSVGDTIDGGDECLQVSGSTALPNVYDLISAFKARNCGSNGIEVQSARYVNWSAITLVNANLVLNQVAQTPDHQQFDGFSMSGYVNPNPSSGLITDGGGNDFQMSNFAIDCPPGQATGTIAAFFNNGTSSGTVARITLTNGKFTGGNCASSLRAINSTYLYATNVEFDGSTTWGFVVAGANTYTSDHIGLTAPIFGAVGTVTGPISESTVTGSPTYGKDIWTRNCTGCSAVSGVSKFDWWDFTGSGYDEIGTAATSTLPAPEKGSKSTSTTTGEFCSNTTGTTTWTGCSH